MSRFTLCRRLLLCVLPVLTTLSSHAETLHVSPKGPLTTLAAARDAARQLRASGSLHGPLHIVIADGTYALTKPFTLTPEDSGDSSSSTIYEAAPHAHPVISAGRRITGFQRGTDGLWTVHLPEVQAGKGYFEQLWINGRRATRARTPNSLYLYTRGKVPGGNNQRRRAFIANAEDIAPLLKLPPAELHDVTAVVYHSWEASRLRIASVDAKTNIITFTGPSVWPFMDWNPTQRYQLENYRAALDQSGEWFLSRDGTLTYKPLPGEDPRTAEVVAPVGEQFVQIQGTAGKKVTDIVFRGLTFAYSGYTLPDAGQGDGQAAVSIPAVIQADDAARITLENCEIAHTGLYGVWFRQGCTDCAVKHSYLHDLGAGGIRFGETEIRPDGPERTGHNSADNNIIRSDGRLFPGAIGIWIGQSGNNQVTHNDISDTYYTGVSVGWTWGYGPSLARNNHIDFNRIHQIGQGVLSDMGGVYTLGISDGSTVSHNVIHDVYAYNLSGPGGWGLYNDEGSSHITLQDNLVYDVHTGMYHQHYGEENVVQNNIFAFSHDGQLQRSRVEDRLAFHFRRNVIVWSRGTLLAGSWEKNTELDHNLYWNTAAQPVDFEGQTLAQWQAAGHDTGSLIADPGFVNAQKRDFALRPSALKPNSPLAKIGFQPFDFQQAGVYGDAVWKHLASDYHYVPFQFAPPPPPAPPVVLHQDFEDLAVGEVCPDAQTNVENQGDSILVTDETAASGKHSLKFTDAPGLKNSYDPHLVLPVNHTAGVTTLEFALRVEPGVDMTQEWRDWNSQPYKTGPTFTIQSGHLMLGGKSVMEIPSGVWVHYQVRAAIGKSTAGHWELAVTLPGQPAHRFADLPNASPDFAALTWIGFISNATDKTVFYLDDLDLSNHVGGNR